MMKPLRGTAFDPFGYTRVRRTERELAGEYRAMIEGTLATLSEETYGRRSSASRRRSTPRT
jgi:indolepyruvate ferredoxin oxidoreductase